MAKRDRHALHPRGGCGRAGGVSGRGVGVAGGGGVAVRSLAAEQEPPPFWFRRLARLRPRRGGRSVPVPPRPRPRPGGRGDAARSSPCSAPAALPLTR